MKLEGVQQIPGYRNCRLHFSKRGEAARKFLATTDGLMFGCRIPRQYADEGWTIRIVFVQEDLFEDICKKLADTGVGYLVEKKDLQADHRAIKAQRRDRLETKRVLNLDEPRPCPDVSGKDITRDLLANAAK